MTHAELPWESAERHVDFDVHGIVGIRLENPSAADAAMVERQLGPLRRQLDREPDIVVRFVDHLSISGVRFVDFGRTGFTEDGFFYLRRGADAVRVKLAFEEIGGRCELVCQRGLHSVPLLLAIVTLTALKYDFVGLHASAFVWDGAGVLVTGWAKGGKTTALLAFADRGAEYVGDEWILLSGDGRRMYGIPQAVGIQDWHLQQLPRLRRHVPWTRRVIFRTIRRIDAIVASVPGTGTRRSLPARMLADLLGALRRRLNVQLDPAVVFPARVASWSAAPEHVFVMVSHDDPTTRVESMDPVDLAARMAVLNCYEQQQLTAGYLAYQFAFPGRRNAFLESVPARQAEILNRALAGQHAFMVLHPYPCDLHDVYSAMQPHIRYRAGVLSRAAEAEAIVGGAGFLEAAVRPTP